MPKKILLADDSITIQKVVELTFSDGDYEVTAVNNGAKAIQKLSEMRPDIILSDIIMPEKNGYEVCEFVKSHPDYRTIPLILLTGTFEPFDPDRADKAGCDAVVTKPFESQSLIQKVEELLQSSASANGPAPAESLPQPDVSSPAETPQTPLTAPNFAPPPQESPFSTPSSFAPASAEPFSHGSDIFGAVSAPPGATTEMPFEQPALGGETRAFQRVSFEELQKMAAETNATPPPPPAAAPPPPPPAPAAEASPWDDTAVTGGETRAFPRMSFEDLQKMAGPADAPAAPATPPPPPPPPAQQESPFGDAGATGGETRAFPRMSFEDLQKMAAEPATPPPPPVVPAPPAAPETSPWDEPAATGGDTRAFPALSFDEPEKPASPPPAPAASTPEPAAPPAPAAAAAPEASPWDETPAFSGETRAFPRMSFEDLQKMAGETAAPPPPPPPPPAAPSAPEPEESPWAVEPEAETPLAVAEPEEPAETATPTPFAAEEEEPAMPFAAVSATPAATESASSPTGGGMDLSDDQVDRIARRVVQLMSEQVVRNIAWEIIPDMAEMVVKERIRQLENEG